MSVKKKLAALIDMFTVEIRDAFAASIQDIVDTVVLAEVVDAIERGDVELAFRRLGFSGAAMRPLTNAIERAFEQGGVFTGEQFPKFLNTPSGRAVFRFDVRNSRAESWLREHSSTLISNIEEETRANVRSALTVGMEAGRNPRSVALDIVGRVEAGGSRTGGVVGLTNQQEAWAQSARARLVALDKEYFTMALRDKRFDRTVQAAIEAGKPLPADTVEKLVTRYKANALKYRGEMIARTEAMQSLGASEYEAMRQAVDIGAVTAEAVKREWDATMDKRTRISHQEMDGQRVGLNQAFVSPVSGAHMLYPGDTSLGAPASEIINCRCRVKSVIDWLADLD